MSIEKEAELIANITALFMRLGIKSLTMDEIARQLGISKKTLYKYVSDKKELVTKSVQFAISQEECMLSELDSIDGNAIDKILAINQMVSQKLQSIQPSVIFDLQKYYPEAWQVMEGHKKNFIFNQVENNLQEGIKEGLYRDNINCKITAQIYVTLIDSIFNSTLFQDNSFSFHEIHTEVARYHLKGIASEEGVEYIKSVFNKKKHTL